MNNGHENDDAGGDESYMQTLMVLIKQRQRTDHRQESLWELLPEQAGSTLNEAENMNHQSNLI